MNTRSGIKIGAVVGFLLWFTADFMFYGISNAGSLTSTVVDPFLELGPGAVAGGVIAAVLGRLRAPVGYVGLTLLDALMSASATVDVPSRPSLAQRPISLPSAQLPC